MGIPALIHAVNFLIFLLLVPCFEFFWSTVFRYDVGREERLPHLEGAWWVVGYTMLAITAHTQGAIRLVSPDLIVTGLLLLASGIFLKVCSSTSNLTDYLALGVVLGFGYLAKAPMFQVAFIFFLAATLRRKFDRQHLFRLGASVLAFAFISCPFVFLLSKRSGHLTIGESGRLNWAWMINGVSPKFLFWQGGPRGSGLPLHPPRLIWRSPDAYEFASPIHATYPLWYDPYYWYQGVRAHLDARPMIRAAILNAKTYLRFFFTEYYVPVVTILLFLSALHTDCLAVLQNLKKHWPLLLVVVCALGMFGLILVESRYVAGYLLLLFALLFLATGAFSGSRTSPARAAAFSLVVMALPMLRWGISSERQLDVEQDNFNIAAAVQQSGILPGDQIAFVGDAIGAYWAKLDKVSIVAEIPSHSTHYWDDEYRPVTRVFWQCPESEQAAISAALGKTGAKAILAWTPSSGVPKGWQQVGHTRLCVKFLP